MSAAASATSTDNNSGDSGLNGKLTCDHVSSDSVDSPTRLNVGQPGLVAKVRLGCFNTNDVAPPPLRLSHIYPPFPPFSVAVKLHGGRGSGVLPVY